MKVNIFCRPEEAKLETGKRLSYNKIFSVQRNLDLVQLKIMFPNRKRNHLYKKSVSVLGAILAPKLSLGSASLQGDPPADSHSFGSTLRIYGAESSSKFSKGIGVEDLGSSHANSARSSFFNASNSARASLSKFDIDVDCSLGSLRSFGGVHGGVVGIILD